MSMEQHSLLIEDPAPVHVSAPSICTVGTLKRTGIRTSLLVMFGMLLVSLTKLTPLTKHWTPLKKHSRDSFALGAVSLEEQYAWMQKWQDAVNMTKEVATDLQGHLDKVRETADSAREQIDAWAQAKAAENNDQISEYVELIAKAAVKLSNLETAFKGWCFTQSALFNTQKMSLEKAFNKADGGIGVNIDVSNALLQRTVNKGLDGLESMMDKIEGVQADFAVLAEKAVVMERQIKEEKKDLDEKATWATLGVVGAGLTCVGGVLTGAALEVATFATSTLFSAGISVIACGGAGIGGGATVIACADQWEHTLMEQAERCKTLGTRATVLESRAKADHDEMENVKQELDFLDGLLLPDVDLFQAAVLPEIKHLVGILQKMAGKQQILAAAE